MMVQLAVITCLALFTLLLAEPGLRGAERILRERHHRKGKPKLHFSSSQQHVHTKYGVELPAFAFDYSEFFTGAVIERSESEDLFLSVFILGHQSVITDFPFHAISTDEEVLSAWSRGVTKWASMQTAPNTDAKAEVMQSLHKPSPTHTPYGSGLACVVRNNDGSGGHHVYQTSAYWVNSQYEKDGSSIKNTFSVLRCRLRNGAFVYANATFTTDQEVFVDIMRLNTHKRPFMHRNISKTSIFDRFKANRRDSTMDGRRRATSDVSVATDSRGVVLLSFSIPWTSRVVGFPLLQYPYRNATSNFDLWSTSGPSALLRSSADESNHETEQSRAIKYPKTPLERSTLLCVPGLRPLHPKRAEVGLPMLIEFIEHHLQLGFSHISIAMDIDGLSGYMTKHVHVLQQYIRAGLVSLHSTSLPGYDDVPGFAGVQLHDAVSQQFFINQCLYLAKGLTKYVTVLHADEFLIPHGKSTLNNDSDSFVSALLDKFEKVSAAIPSNNENSAAVSHCSFALTPTGKDFHAPGTIVGQLHVYGVDDPANSFGEWGPAESSWSRDYFASSSPKLLHSGATQTLRFFPTDKVVRVEVSSVGHITGYCRHGTSYHRGSGRLHSVLSHSDRSGNQRVSQYTATATIPSEHSAALFVYKGSFPEKLLAGSANDGEADMIALVQSYLKSREVINEQIATNLKHRGMLSVKEVKDLVKEAAALHNQRHFVRANIYEDLAHHVPRTAAAITSGTTGNVALPGRADVKSPFWQLCDTDYLSDVIKRVFHPHF